MEAKHFFLVLLFFPLTSVAAKSAASVASSMPIEKIIIQGTKFRLPRDSKSLDASALWMKKNQKESVSSSGADYVITSPNTGENTIYSGQNAITVQSLSPASMKLYRSFQSIIKSMPGLRLQISDGLIQVKGRFYQYEEWKELVSAAALTFGRWQNLTSNSDELQSKINSKISKALKERNLMPQLPERNRANLELNLPAQVKAYGEALGKFGITTSLNPDGVSLAPMIKVQITVAEIKKSFGEGLGLDWPQQIKATLLPGSAPQYENLVFGAKAFENSGEGRILASPTLLTRSGKEADFLAGGEFPIKILNYKMQDVIWKQYGIRLKIKPTVDSSGKMSLAIETEVSMIDEAHTIDGVPGMLSNRMTTHLDLQRSKVVALSGLIKSEQGKSSSGLAGLSRIPILGSLFSSEDFRENRSELVIFVRPSLVDEF